MKHNIGSKQAEKLARGKYGDKTFVARSGKVFLICAPVNRPGFLLIGRVRGQGKSWETALMDAGIAIPNVPVEPEFETVMVNGVPTKLSTKPITADDIKEYLRENPPSFLGTPANDGREDK